MFLECVNESFFMCSGFGMMTPNGLQPYSTISYANGPGFDDHFDQVIISFCDLK